jgi:hypothetical protein
MNNNGRYQEIINLLKDLKSWRDWHPRTAEDLLLLITIGHPCDFELCLIVIALIDLMWRTSSQQGKLPRAGVYHFPIKLGRKLFGRIQGIIWQDHCGDF